MSGSTPQARYLRYAAEALEEVARTLPGERSLWRSEFVKDDVMCLEISYYLQKALSPA